MTVLLYSLFELFLCHYMELYLNLEVIENDINALAKDNII